MKDMRIISKFKNDIKIICYYPFIKDYVDDKKLIHGWIQFS